MSYSQTIVTAALLVLFILYITQGKNLQTCRPKLSFLRYNTVYCVKAAFCCLRVKWKIKKITMVDFSATNTLYLLNKYEHMNRHRKAMVLRLKAMSVA